MSPYRNLPDVQSRQDDRNVPIDRVGLKGLEYPITVFDRKNGRQTTVAKVNMYVNLPHNFRGTHMSRFVEILNEYRGTEWMRRTGEILSRIRETLQADEAHMEIEFPYFMVKEAPVTKQQGLMSYKCRFHASYQSGETTTIGVTVPVITLCPCSKELAEYSAHNQRCSVDVNIKYNKFVWLEELIELVESSASGQLYSILKRPDEKYITEHTYDNPMFVEDIVREVAIKLDVMERVTWYTVEAESQESIHNHNAYAMIEKTK